LKIGEELDSPPPEARVAQTSDGGGDASEAKPGRRRWFPAPVTAAPVYCLLVIVGLSTVGILVLGNPSPKTVDMSLRCKGFALPSMTNVDIKKVSAVQMRGFGLEFDHIVTTRLAQDIPDVAIGPGDNLSLLPPSGSLVPVVPVVRLSIDETAPRVTFSLASGTYVSTDSCGSDSAACMTFHAAESNAIDLDLQATRIGLDAHRVVVMQHDGPQTSRLLQDFRATLDNPVGVINARSVSSTHDPVVTDFTATLVFQPKTDAELGLASTSDGKKGADPVAVSFRDCLVSVARINGTPTDTSAKDIAQNLEAVGGLNLRSIKLPAPVDDHTDRHIDIVGSGELTSFLVGGRQTLPTRLDELLSGTQQNRGLFGFAGLLYVFAIGIIAKRAFEKLADRLMPGPEKK
jgi:hypothetical protein